MSGWARSTVARSAPLPPATSTTVPLAPKSKASRTSGKNTLPAFMARWNFRPADASPRRYVCSETPNAWVKPEVPLLTAGTTAPHARWNSSP